jgi:hypothetical protein
VRLRALFLLVRAGNYRRWVSDLAGYDGRRLGEVTRIE